MNTSAIFYEKNFFADEKSFELFHSLNDSSFPAEFKANRQIELIQDRSLLRKFLTVNGFKQPEFLASDKFEPLSAWTVKRNRFPLLIKSVENTVNCQKAFNLKAFRELPAFFEQIYAESSSKMVMIEDYIPAKARIEVTFFNNKPVFIAQTGLEKSLQVACCWRVFPVSPPKSCMAVILKIQHLFAEILSLKEIPIRVSFAYRADATVPLSLNLGFNRLEYHSGWGSMLETDKSNRPPKGLYKLLFYKVTPESQKMINKNEVAEMLKSSFMKMETGNNSAILLYSENPSDLLEDSKKADAFFKHLGQDYDLPAEEN